MITRLYIIGNGFDRHHLIRSGYYNFRDWCVKNRNYDPDEIEPYFAIKDFWGSFEENLAKFAAAHYAHDITFANPTCLMDENVDMNMASTEVENTLSDWWNQMKDNLDAWVKTLSPPCRLRKIKADFSNAKVLTFNYTKTLESLYGVNPIDILHVHGCTGDNKSNLCIGCPCVPKSQPYLQSQEEPINITDGIAETWAIDSASRQAAQWIKPVRTIIEKNSAFFNMLNNVTTIHSYGFSFSDVDMPYIDKVIQSVSPTAKWVVSVHNQEERFRITNKLTSQGAIGNIEYICLMDVLRYPRLRKMIYRLHEALEC